MKNKYLGIICLLYSFIISYLWFSNKLKNFLAPQMQLYIKISIIPLVLIGIVLLINKDKYKFKLSDIFLLIPLILLILSSDGRITTNMANNRIRNHKVETKTIEKQETTIEEEKTIEPIEEKEYDFTNVTFDITDTIYNELSNYLSYEPNAIKYVGNTIRVKGFTVKYASYLPDDYFAIGKYAISCCVADAEFTGFFVKYDRNKIIHNAWYEIEGVLEQGKDKDGNAILYINAINVKEIEEKNEEQYVYPCYAYDNGLCNDLNKYNLEY